jgi:hypothetical protein
LNQQTTKEETPISHFNSITQNATKRSKNLKSKNLAKELKTLLLSGELNQLAANSVSSSSLSYSQKTRAYFNLIREDSFKYLRYAFSIFILCLTCVYLMLSVISR